MRIEATETSLHLLLFPLPLGRGRWGLGQHSQGTPAPEILAQVFYQLQIWFVLVCFFQDPFPVTGFAWKPATLPSSKMQGEEQSRFPGSWGTCDPQTRIRFTWADRFTYCTASLAPTLAPSWQVSTATWMCQGATSQNTLFFILPWLRAGLKP